jgi:hypothetical protein
MDKSNIADKTASMTGESLGAASDAARQAVDAGCETVDAGYDNAREYISSGLNYAGEMSERVNDFVQRQPWVALVGAFVVGYVAAKALRHLSE